jgi:hypothetical protein
MNVKEKKVSMFCKQVGFIITFYSAGYIYIYICVDIVTILKAGI